jgi:hypothetical protein
MTTPRLVRAATLAVFALLLASATLAWPRASSAQDPPLQGPRREISARPPAPPPAGQGSVIVQASPSARVFVDGRDSGLRAPGARLNLPPGPHQIHVVYDDSGQPSAPKTVEVEAGKVASHMFARHEPSGNFKAKCEGGSANDCWQYANALLRERKFNEAADVFDRFARDFGRDDRAKVASFLATQARKRAEQGPNAPPDPAARAALGSLLTGAVAHGSGDPGLAVPQVAAPADHGSGAPGAAAGGAPTTAVAGREAGATPGSGETARGPRFGSATSAEAEGSGGATAAVGSFRRWAPAVLGALAASIVALVVVLRRRSAT